jgi:hypothetical protein
MNESHNAEAECSDDHDNDARLRAFAERVSGPRWAKFAERIGELRREVAVSNNPAQREELQKLEAATNMTAARRVMGGTTMYVDPRYPAPDVYAEAIALIAALPPSRGIRRRPRFRA